MIIECENCESKWKIYVDEKVDIIATLIDCPLCCNNNPK